MKSNADIASIAAWRPSGPGRSWSSAAALGAAALLIGLGAAMAGTRGQREIRGLPGGERVGIYARLVDDLARTCAAPTAHEGALRDHCRQQAAFVVLFPECDARCLSLAKSTLPQARR